MKSPKEWAALSFTEPSIKNIENLVKAVRFEQREAIAEEFLTRQNESYIWRVAATIVRHFGDATQMCVCGIPIGKGHRDGCPTQGVK